MDGTEGLIRGQVVNDTGSPIMIPVGPETLGRIINVVGDPIDERGPVPTDKRQAIHAEVHLTVSAKYLRETIFSLDGAKYSDRIF